MASAQPDTPVGLKKYRSILAWAGLTDLFGAEYVVQSLDEALEKAGR